MVAFKRIIESLQAEVKVISDILQIEKVLIWRRRRDDNRMNGKLTIVLVQDVMTCCTAHGVTTIMKSKEMAAADCEVPSEILLSANI